MIQAYLWFELMSKIFNVLSCYEFGSASNELSHGGQQETRGGETHRHFTIDLLG